jgi:membrane associated rhomboid family serine protease
MIPIRDLNTSRTTPWVTWTIILVCTTVFVFQAVQPAAVQRDIMFEFALIPRRLTQAVGGASDPGAVLSVFASMFMHGGLLHVIGNLWFLRIFGDNVEDNFGHGRYVLFYLLCGAFAAATQWAIDPASTVPMVGASGAIAGVLGAYAVLYPRARVVTLVPIVIFFSLVELPAIVVIAVWFVLQFFSGVVSLGVDSGGGVAYWAHIGGFVAGLLLTLVMRRRPPVVPPQRLPFMVGRVDESWRG